MLVQMFLGVMVLGTLCYKRLQESPRRPLTIWLMDTSKQFFSGGLQHIVNLVLAVEFAGGHTLAGECVWYITNFSITVFCGLFIISGYMKLHRMVVEKYNITSLRSGEYGEPPKLQVWLVQMLLWCFVACAEKFITASCVILPLREVIDSIIARLEVPLKPYPRIELVLVMVIGPTLLNMVFAWVVDNLIKDPDMSHHGPSSKDAGLEEESTRCSDDFESDVAKEPLMA
jgi:hypothetical protein